MENCEHPRGWGIMNEILAKTTGCEEKMCGLTSCVYDVDVNDIMPLINNPQFICTGCEQVANDKSNLCKPIALSEFKNKNAL